MLNKKFIAGPGESFVWTVPIEYEGSKINTNVRMAFQIPDNFEVIGSNPTRGSYDTAAKVWIIGDMQSGDKQSIALTLQMTVTSDSKSYAFIASATGDSFDNDASNNTRVDTLSIQSVCAKATANADKFGIINFNLAANDIGCTEGTSKWEIDTSTYNNVEVLEYDSRTGVGIARLTNPLSGGGLSYKIYCDVGSGFLETAGPAEVEFYALFDNAWIPNNGGGGAGGAVATLEVNAGLATFNNGNGGSDVTFPVGYTQLTQVNPETVRVTYPNGGVFTFNTSGGAAGATSTYVDNGNGTYTLSNGAGASLTINTISTIVDNGNTFTFTNSNGQQVSVNKVTAANISADAGNDLSLGSDNGVYFAETLTGISYDSTTGNLIYTNEAGQAQIVNLDKENFLSAASYDTATKELVLTMKNGAVVRVPLTDLVDDDTLTVLSQGNGQIQYLDENGNSTSIQVAGTIAIGQGNFTYTGGAGASPVVVQTGEVSQDANNNLIRGADGLPFFSEKVTSLTKNGDGSLTYVDELGGSSIIVLGASSAGDPVTSVAFTPATRILTVSLQSGATFSANIPTAATETITDNNDGTFTFVSSDDTTTTVDFLADVTDNSDGTYTYTNAIGGTQTIDTRVSISQVAGNTITVETDGGIYAADVVTQLGYTNGTLTYTNEAGQVTNISLPTENFLSGVVYNQTTKVLTFSFEDTDNVDVSLADLVDSETLTSITRSGGQLTYTDENAGTFTFFEGGVSTDADNAIIGGTDGKPYFNESLTEISIDSNVITYVDENGVDTDVTIPKQTIVETTPGSYTFNDGYGDSTVIDVNAAPTEEAFTDLATGNSITLATTIGAESRYDVYKNGLLQELGFDFSLTESIPVQVVFTSNFDGTKNGNNGDRVLVRIYKA